MLFCIPYMNQSCVSPRRNNIWRLRHAPGRKMTIKIKFGFTGVNLPQSVHSTFMLEWLLIHQWILSRLKEQEIHHTNTYGLNFSTTSSKSSSSSSLKSSQQYKICITPRKRTKIETQPSLSSTPSYFVLCSSESFNNITLLCSGWSAWVPQAIYICKGNWGNKST